MNIAKLLIATGNKGKLAEFEQYFAKQNRAIEITSLAGFNLIEPEENGSTFAENALIKATYYSNKTNLIALADDSGLSIDQLDGDPGIYSARWAGQGKNFKIAMARVKQELKYKNITLDQVTASFHCVLCLYYPNHIVTDITKQKLFFSGQIKGKISFPPRGDNGFGYDPIFIPNGHDITLAQMANEEKEAISHRTIAIKKLYQFFDSLK